MNTGVAQLVPTSQGSLDWVDVVGCSPSFLIQNYLCIAYVCRVAHVAHMNHYTSRERMHTQGPFHVR